jgi:hypothetical protein
MAGLSITAPCSILRLFRAPESSLDRYDRVLIHFDGTRTWMITPGIIPCAPGKLNYVHHATGTLEFHPTACQVDLPRKLQYLECVD